MSSIDFKIRYELDEVISDNYVTLQAGKGKRENSTVYIDVDTYSFIEGLIWNKYREYRQAEETKIKSPDWIRVVDGIRKAKDKLVDSDIDNMKKILMFNIMTPQFPLSDLDSKKPELIIFLDQFSEWVVEVTKKDKYITIYK